MTILLPSLAVLIPILTLPFWLFHFDVAPKVAVLLLGAAAACAFSPWRIESLRQFVNTSAGRRITALLGLQILALALSTAFSDNPQLSLGGTNWRMFGLVTQSALLLFVWFAAAAIAQHQISLRPLLRAIALSGSVIAVYSILQYLGWDPLLPSATYHIGEGEWTIVRPPGTIGHADYLGGYLVFAVFLGGSLSVLEKAPLWRAVGFLVIITGSFAIVLSGTRSAMAGLVVGALVLLYRVRPAWPKVAAGALLSAALLASFYYSPLGLKMRSRARWIREDPSGGARPLLWRDSLRMAVDRPLLGWGPETFSTDFPRFQSLELARAFPDFYHESPHNIEIDSLVANGIAGCLPFLLWCAFAARAAWRGTRDPRMRMASAALLAGLLTLQFNAFVLTTAFFFFLTSVLVLTAEPVAEAAATSRVKPSWWAALPAFPLALIFLTAAVRLLVSDVLLNGVRARIETGNIVAASALYDVERRWDPRPGSADLYYSRNVAPLGRRQPDILYSVKVWQEAVQAALRSTRLAEDRQNAFYHLASLYAAVNNHQDTEKSLRSAIACAPNWFKPHWTLAQLLETEGRHAEARKEANTALQLDAGQHPEVFETTRKILVN